MVIFMALFVNKKNIFNEDLLDVYEFVEYENHREEIIYVESETFKHFEMLKAHLKVDGIIIDIDDAYRSLEKQENIFLEYMNKYGMDYAEKYVAMPGFSEHHTGMAIDICIYKKDRWIENNDDLLKEKRIFNKIHKDLKYFGFILRYPKGKEGITGYNYEPWHIRYVGDEVDRIGDLTLEEYMEELKAMFPEAGYRVDPLSLSVSCHIGPGALALACTKNLL